MSVISQGFSTNYTINKVETIKPGAAGTMDNGQNYKASVKFLTRNIVTRDNQQVGLQEVESTLEFVIPCDSNEQASLVTEAIRKLRETGSIFTISGDLPVKFERNAYPFVKSFDMGGDFLKKVESITKIKAETKAAS